MLVATPMKSQKARDLRKNPREGGWKSKESVLADARPLTEGNEAGAAITLLVEYHNQSVVIGGGEIGARGVTKMMIEASNAAGRISSHFAQDAKIIQLAAKFAKSLISKVDARNG